MIKQLLPKRFKQFLWFVFKSPQRRWHELGYGTLLTDLKGWWYTSKHITDIKPITVCIGIKNRSSNLLNFVIPSLNQAKHSELITLSVYDCGSDDIDNLEEAIKTVWKGKLIYQRNDQAFARSKSFNSAVKQSADELVLICDADMSVPKNIVNLVNQYVTAHSAWFPHVWYTNQDGSGRYYTESTGMMATNKATFLKVGGYDETITTWGYEDWYLFFAFYKHHIACIRSNEPEFIHHYHESLKPEGFKALF
jgi:predicted glycosyltransferase involved in capsule biosynthesis